MKFFSFLALLVASSSIALAQEDNQISLRAANSLDNITLENNKSVIAELEGREVVITCEGSHAKSIENSSEMIRQEVQRQVEQKLRERDRLEEYRYRERRKWDLW